MKDSRQSLTGFVILHVADQNWGAKEVAANALSTICAHSQNLHKSKMSQTSTPDVEFMPKKDAGTFDTNSSV